MDKECEPKKSNNSGLKAVGLIMTIIAVITGMAAIVRPLQNQISSLERQIADVKSDLTIHSQENNHPWGVLSNLAALQEKFVEVETQFKGLREREDLRQDSDAFRLDKLEKWQDWWYQREIDNHRKE